MSPADYLKKPYSRLVVPEEDGSFRAEILEFPGCIATGDTAAKAYGALEEVAESWLQATLAKGQSVPEPAEESEFSGKLVVRLPKSLHRKAARAARRDGASLNQFIVSCISEQVGIRSAVTSVFGFSPFHLVTGTLQPIAAANSRPSVGERWFERAVITSSAVVTHGRS
jgi:predicted HicB family RNase H-like nuclease